MSKLRLRNAPSIENEVVLLVGLLYHGTQQHDGLILRNICKDALERAHRIHKKAKKLKTAQAPES